MAHNKHLRNEANKTEIEQRDQYYQDRAFIARFLENNLRGSQAANVLQRFWSYRCEDGEIEIVMGRKRDYKRTQRLTIRDEEDDESLDSN